MPTALLSDIASPQGNVASFDDIAPSQHGVASFGDIVSSHGVASFNDVAPSGPPTPSTWERIQQAVGRAIPEAATGPLAQANRYLVQPFNCLAQAGADAGREAGRDVVTSTTLMQHAGDYLSATVPSPYGPKSPVENPEHATEREHPIALGVAGGLGSAVGSTVTDVRNWPFFASAAARPLLQKVIARGFATQMAAQTYQGAKELYDRWDKLSPTERAEIGTRTGVGALFLAKGLSESAGKKTGATETPTHTTHAIDPDSSLGKLLAEPAPNVRVTDSAATARDLIEKDTIAKPNEAAPDAQARVTGPSGTAAFVNPTARVVRESHIPVANNDEILATAVHSILGNSDELQKTNIDMSSIKTDRDIEAALMRVSDVIKSHLDDRTYATIGFEMQKQLAAETGLTVEQLLSHPNGIALNAENLLAARMILKQSYNHVLELTRTAASSGDVADREAATVALSQHKAIQERIAGFRKESGRALGSWRIGGADLPATKIANVFEKLPVDIQGEAVKLISRLDQNDPRSVRALNELVEKIKPATTLEKLHEWYRNSLLSSPHTLIVKTASEISMVAMETMKKAVAGGISKFKDSPDRFAAESWYYAKGLAQALSEHARPILSGAFQLEGSPGFERAGQQAIKGKLGSVIRVPSEAMSRMTNLLYTGNYFGEINSLAARQAISEGLSGDGFNARQEYLSHHPSEEMSESAHDLAMRNTFQSRLGPFAEKIGQAIATKPTAKWMPEWAKGVAPLKWLFPFYKTPINLVRATLTHATPYELLNGIAKGDTDALARGLVGSSIAASLAALALSGHLTGGGPTDYRKEETKRATGWQPYSLKIGDKYYSYHRFEPVGLAAGMIADAVHGMQHGDSEIVSGSKADTAVKHIARNLDDLAFMGTLANLLQAVHDPVGGRAQSFINREAGSLVPAGVANVAETMDPTVRRPQSALQAIESRVPGLTSAAPPITDITGKHVERPFSNLGGANSFPFTTAKHDPVVDELARLGISTPQPPTQIKWRGKPTQLTDAERQQFAQLEGAELYKRVGRLIQSGVWQRRSDDQKRKALIQLHGMIDSARPARLTRIRRDGQAELAINKHE
jgi:hypothetical protein